mmetsp:Transcript_20281/g.38157  ORF Transcript_20281/g.38157 Transcript_20281/m.38157 type:complete len:244 (-) Transcript_20281:137-868(-)|eukprot:CAMPEP_0170177724 /NCGR_PEP_ID=MMETSP0040_2-20121228/10905_1 /TAXON_ID=641309 /ORGANISM="Lotharella oceanica, Strain CCMP622" /LENGTH=243 /DNA_ID=CAMNT_0010420487 /DNA_START=41 /DNA_END=772 /DNA_ORIENTATION=+
MVFEKVVVVDGKGHLLGRLASTLAKELQAGQRVVVVRCEEINISGSLFRNKLKYYAFLKKRMNTNPKKGPFHYRSPSRILWRVIRGMIAHKKAKGKAAMDRLKVMEGCPHPFDKMKKLVIPRAIKNIRLKPNRKFCRLGDLSSLAGWRHNDLIEKLEAKRKVKAAAFYEKKLATSKILKDATEATKAECKEIDAQLAELGYGVITPNYGGAAAAGGEAAAEAKEETPAAAEDDEDDDDDDDDE